MSSTRSSPEAPAQERSSTEALAGRYRNLFTLPPRYTLVVLVCVTSLATSVAAERGSIDLAFMAGSLLAAVLGPLVMTVASHSLDKDTVANFNRSAATVFAGGVLWLACVAAGLAAALATGNARHVVNAFVFGAFIAVGFEFLVINGVFLGSVGASVLLGAVHPVLTLAALLAFTSPGPLDPYVVLAGFFALVIFVSFMLTLQRRTTPIGYKSVDLFRAFMKTWAEERPEALERIIGAHATRAEVSTKVMRFGQSGGDVFVVLPGVHPGPFYPIGSYNLPGLLFHKFNDLGPVMTLHRPGGHERNLATREDTERFAASIHDLAASIKPQAPAEVRGPVRTTVGNAAGTAIAFEKDLVTTISFAPLGSEDIELQVESSLRAVAGKYGFDLTTVDAHNSIEPKRGLVDPSDPGWAALFQTVAASPGSSFTLGYAHSDEIGVKHGSDMTEAGIGLAMLGIAGSKHALILADANNAVPSLRQAVSQALEAEGVHLLELCTSDSHDRAARGLTVGRGYMALGEATDPRELVGAIVRLARLAEGRLAPASYASGTLASTVNVFGAEALDEYAELTESSTRFARRYATFMLASCLALLALCVLV